MLRIQRLCAVLCIPFVSVVDLQLSCLLEYHCMEFENNSTNAGTIVSTNSIAHTHTLSLYEYKKKINEEKLFASIVSFGIRVNVAKVFKNVQHQHIPASKCIMFCFVFIIAVFLMCYYGLYYFCCYFFDEDTLKKQFYQLN